MRNYFTKLRLNYKCQQFSLIYTQIRQKLLPAQERFKSDMELRYQTIVSVIHFKKIFFEVYDTNNLVQEVSQLKV